MTRFPLNDSSLPIETVTVYRPSGTQEACRWPQGKHLEIEWSSIHVLDHIVEPELRVIDGKQRD